MQYVRHIYDTGKMTDDDRRAAVEWVRTLGLDPDRLKPRFAVVRGHDEWELHVTRTLRGLGGKGDLIDLAQQEVVGMPAVVHLGTLDEVWPNFGTEGLIP